MNRIVGIGDLVVDLYYRKNRYIGACGGKTFSNICANLGSRGVKTAVFGICGNDRAGKIAVDSLRRVNVDVANVDIKDTKTRLFHITRSKTTKKCPYCGKKTWYFNSKLDTTKIIKKILYDDIVVIDNLNAKTLKILKGISNKVLIDIGYYKSLDKISDRELILIIRNRFEMINLNNRVYEYFVKRFNISSAIDLYYLLKPKLLIITLGSVGAYFIFEKGISEKRISDKALEVDVNGAGDAFFSIFIEEYMKNNYVVDQKYIDESFNKAVSITKNVVESIGARGHIDKLYMTSKSLCICNSKADTF